MSKKNELTTFTVVKTDEEFLTQVTKPGLRVLDVFAKFAGPCEPIAPILKRIKVENGDKIGFLQCESDQISCLEGFRDQSCPCFIFIINRILVRIIRGANAPQIEKTIKDHIELEDNGQPHNLVDLDDLSGPIVAFIAPAQSTIQPESEHETEPERDAEQSAETDENGDPQVMTVPLKGSRRVSIVLNDQIDADVNALLQAPLTEDGPVENTLAMLKPDAMYPSIIEDVMSILYHHRFKIVNIKKVWLTADQAEELYKESVSMDYFERLVEYMSCAPVLAIELSRSNAIQAWRELVGQRDPRDAKKDSPKSLRGMYGQDRLVNSFHASDGPVSAERELAFLFTSPPETFLSMPFEQPTAEPKGSNYNGLPQKTLAVIKPHAMLKVDSIISKIVARGIQITKREEAMLSVERAQELSVEFLETPAFEESVQTLTSGPLLLLTLKAENVIEAWLEMLGPSDPETAKTLFPMSLRARYGISPIENALHGSATIEVAIEQLHTFFPHYLNRNSSMGSIFKTPIGSRRASQAGSRNLLASESVRSSVVQLEKERHRLKSAAVSMYASSMGLGAVPFVERTLAVLKPDVYPDLKNQILQLIRKDGFEIVGEMEFVLDKGRAEEFYRKLSGKPFFEDLTHWMSNHPIGVYVLEKAGAIKAWRNLMGPTSSKKAREESPNSIRALFGTDILHNACHGSDSPSSAAHEIGFFFGSEVSSKPVTQRTMALIKPDAYPTHKNDIVARIIKNGFNIIKQGEVQFDLGKAEEFYKDHAGKPFFEELTTWMSSAPIYGLVLERPAAIIEWRNLMGHTNSNIAREVAPYTIRAHYGTDGSHNAVHGSDSPENAAREIMAVFGNWEAEEEAARQAAIEQERLRVKQQQEEEERQQRAELEAAALAEAIANGFDPNAIAPPAEAADVTEPIPEDDATKVPQEPKTPRPPSSGNPNPRSKSTIKKSPSKPALKSKSPSTVNVGGLVKSPSSAQVGLAKSASKPGLGSASASKANLKSKTPSSANLGAANAANLKSKSPSSATLGVAAAGSKTASKAGSKAPSSQNLRELAQ